MFLARSVSLCLSQELFSLTSHLTQVLLVCQQLLEVGLGVVLDQHTRDFGHLLVAKCVLQTRIDQVAHHLLTLFLTSKALDQVKTEILRKRNFNSRLYNFSLLLFFRLSLLLGLLRRLVLVLGVRNCLTALYHRLSTFSFLDLLRFLLFSTAKNLVAELIDVLHELLLSSFLSFSIEINFAHPELDVDWITSKDTCFVKVSDRILTTVHILEKNAC